MVPAEEQVLPEFSDVLAARKRFDGRVKRTPVINDPGLDEALGCRAWIKCENLQETSSFKLRGATNAIARLREVGIFDDVATHSSGNHGAALALAASRDGRRAFVVMPLNSVPAKIEAVRSYGGEVILCEPGQAPRERGLAELVKRGLLPIPPYDHPDIIAGQGTAALELIENVNNFDILMTPIGGGGLLAGSAIAARGLHPGIKVLAAEPDGAADAATSFQRGVRVTDWQPDTIADGLRAVIGVMNFEIIRQKVDDILLVTDHAIEDAMRLVWQKTSMQIEPSSAVVVAAILLHPDIFKNNKVGLIFTGGNVDRKLFPWMDEPQGE